MPIYEYKCASCGEHFEKIQKASDEPLKECEKCGGDLEKQWSLSGFQFKGEGWYVTDYAGKNGSSGKSDSEPAKSESTKESTESAKPASKEKSSSSKKEET